MTPIETALRIAAADFARERARAAKRSVQTKTQRGTTDPTQSLIAGSAIRKPSNGAVRR